MAWLAAARIGAVTLPLSTLSTSIELQGLLRSSDIEVFFSTPSFRTRDYVADLREVVPAFDPSDGPPLYTPELPVLRRIVFDPAPMVQAGVEMTDGLLAATETVVRPSDRMVIVHTSGSTSEPKGVIHQHGPLIDHIVSLNKHRHYTADEVLFSNSPFFWIGGFAFSLLGTLVQPAQPWCAGTRRMPGRRSICSSVCSQRWVSASPAPSLTSLSTPRFPIDT